MKDVSRYGREGTLRLRFIRPFEVVSKVGQTSYKLLLPNYMLDVHDVFNVYALRKWVTNVNRRIL